MENLINADAVIFLIPYFLLAIAFCLMQLLKEFINGEN